MQSVLCLVELGATAPHIAMEKMHTSVGASCHEVIVHESLSEMIAEDIKVAAAIGAATDVAKASLRNVDEVAQVTSRVTTTTVETGNRARRTTRESTQAPRQAAPVRDQEPRRIYSARELVRRADAGDPFHNFPESFNQAIFRGNRQVISENYVLYTKRGEINGVKGTFGIGVRPSASGRNEVITHRFFRPDPK